MKIRTDEKLMARYLLGDMKEEERVVIEERFFGDDEFYAQMTAIQEELIDDYLQGDLSGREREFFESHFLSSPKRRERVEFAAALARVLPQAETKRETVSWWRSAQAFIRAQNPAFVSAMSAAMLVILFGMIWLMLENRRMGAQLEQSRNERADISKQAQANKTDFERQKKARGQEIASLQSQRDDLNAKLQEERERVEDLKRRAANESRSSSNNFIAFALPAGLVSRNSNDPGNEPHRLVIPPETDSIRLQLEMDKEENYQSYRVELRTAGSNLVWSQALLTARQMGYAKAVLLTIPARVLPLGEYEVTLRGASANGELEVIGYYYFIAIKR